MLGGIKCAIADSSAKPHSYGTGGVGIETAQGNRDGADVVQMRCWRCFLAVLMEQYVVGVSQQERERWDGGCFGKEKRELGSDKTGWK